MTPFDRWLATPPEGQWTAPDDEIEDDEDLFRSYDDARERAEEAHDYYEAMEYDYEYER